MCIMIAAESAQALQNQLDAQKAAYEQLLQEASQKLQRKTTYIEYLEQQVRTLQAEGALAGSDGDSKVAKHEASVLSDQLIRL